MWPESESVLRGHRAHLLVTLLNHRGAPIDRKLRLTRLVAAVAQVSDAVGVYWGDGPSVHSTALLLDGARSATAESPPMHTWLGLSLARPVADRISALTFGMEAFGQPNLLIDGPAGSATLAYLFDIASCMVTSNATINDSDTIGESATQRLVVHYKPSPADPTQTILAVELPADFGQ